MDPSRRPPGLRHPSQQQQQQHHSPRHHHPGQSHYPARDQRYSRAEHQRQHPVLVGPAGYQVSVPLVTNAYRLGLSKPGIFVHEYSLQIGASTGCKNIAPEVFCKNFVSRSIRKLLMEKIVPQLVGKQEYILSVVLDFTLNAIYSIQPFKPLATGSGAGTLSSEKYVFKNVAVMTDLLAKLHIDIELKYTKSIPLDAQESDLELMMSILNHQLNLNMLRFGPVYYVSPNDNEHQPTISPTHRFEETRLDLISRHVLGIALSGIRRCSLDKSFVVVSCTHSYITQSHRLIDLLATFLNSRTFLDPPHEKLPEIDNISLEDLTIFNSILNGFKCQATGLDKRLMLRFSLSDEPSTSLPIDQDNPNSPTAFEYYKQKNIKLKYENLPCLRTRDANYPYVPLEMCSLLPNQKVPIFRLHPNARNHLVQLNKPKPDAFKQSSVKARDMVAADNDAQFKSFGLEIGSRPLTTDGSLLRKPILMYHNRTVEPTRDYWESQEFAEVVHLVENWCVVDTVGLGMVEKDTFFSEFSQYCQRVGLQVGRPHYIERPKQSILDQPNSLDLIVAECRKLTPARLRFLMFIIDSSSTALNRMIHLSFDDRPKMTAACLRAESILNVRQHRSIFRTLVHKLNTRLGGTNFTFHDHSLAQMSINCQDLLIIGLDVTHPDNELSGVSIVGCAYTYSSDLFRHRSLVWPQTARVEIIGKMDELITRVLTEYYVENQNRLPRQIIIYRDGVSHEEFERVREHEVSKTLKVLAGMSIEKRCTRPELSYIIAQKRHTMRFFQMYQDIAANPPGGTLIDQDVVMPNGREFYLYANTSPQATARPIHYHVLTNGLGIDNLQKLTYYLCFNFGKCSGTLSMPSSLRYAHNAAYDARNRVIASKEFSENKFYVSRFFC